MAGVRLRYDDPGMPDGHRWARFDTLEEALAQAAHDQARDGRSLNVVVFDGDDEVKLDRRALAAATKKERKRLERVAVEGDRFDADRLLAGLTPSEFDRLRAAVEAASS